MAVQVMKWLECKETAFLFQVLRRYLKGSQEGAGVLQGLDPAGIDLEKVLRFSIKNGVAGFVHIVNKNAAFLPVECASQLQQQYKAVGFTNLRQLSELVGCLKILKSGGIDVVPLKGVYDADNVFGDLGVYPSSDIDLLVPAERLDESVAVLKKYGYRPIESIAESDLIQSHYHLIYRKDLFAIELHWNLVKRYFSVPDGFWWHGSVLKTYCGVEVSRLSTEKYLLYLVFRLFDHQFAPLKFLVHLAAVVNQASEAELTELTKLARRFGMDRLVRFSLQLVHDLFGIGIPAETDGAGGVCYRFLRGAIVRYLTAEHVNPHRQMAILAAWLLPPKVSLRVFFAILFPGDAEVRLRYQLPQRSNRVLLYRLFNPLLMLFRRK